MRQGQPDQCVTLLLEALAAAAAAGVHRLHHRSLEAQCCLISALRVSARRPCSPLPSGPASADGHAAGSSAATVSGVGAHAAGLHGAARSSDGRDGGGTAQQTVRRAAAAAHALVLAAALQQLLDAGTPGLLGLVLLTRRNGLSSAGCSLEHHKALQDSLLVHTAWVLQALMTVTFASDVAVIAILDVSIVCRKTSR